MLNPDLKLNQKIFDADVEVAPTRAGYGEGLVELGDTNKNVVVLTADLSESTKCEAFEKKFPERFFDVGVAEQNMVAVAAGMAVTGKVPFISSYATFSPGKNWETIRTTVVYNNTNVKVAGHHSGVVTGPDGATHQATEDISSLRSWPGMHIFVPCDSIEAKKVTVHAGNTEGPMYLRFTRDKTPIMTTQDTPFQEGKAQLFWVSDNPKALIVGTGHLLYYGLMAANQLAQEGVETLVANVATIKPLDEISLLEWAAKAGAVVSVEDHQVKGGLGGAVAEMLVKNYPLPMEFIGLQDTFAESGKPVELIEKYGMGTEAIKAAVKKVISRK